ncbi:MAG: phosphoglycerate kinase [Candidatus Levybacteria bacterium]|nr:phosphoglycerate kinase [Candidatus Levybacteria bacterium]
MTLVKDMFLLKDANIAGKTVFLRADLDVPLSEIRNPKSEIRDIEDDTRLEAAMPTIEYLLKQNCRIIIAGHLGRPSSASSGERLAFSLRPIAEWLAERFKIKDSHLRQSFGGQVRFKKFGDFDSWEIGESIILLENLRFHDGEEKNDPDFSKKLASLADLYVNDAFAMSHRNHASIVGITKFLPHFAGLHLDQEINHLNSAMENPKRPLVVIIGGKKIETKLPLVEKMHRIADYVLVGGKIAQENKVLVKVQHEKIVGKKSILLIADSTNDNLSITENSLNNFLEIIPLAKTIIWNGTMGFISSEKEDQFQATRKIAKAIIDSNAYSVVGGGDTVEFLNKLGILDKFSFASTGGGAMLAYLAGEKLPGLEALRA